MPKVSLLLIESTVKATNKKSNEIPMIFSIESDCTHGVDDNSILSAIKHEKELSLVPHYSRVQAEWNPDLNFRFLAAFSGASGDRHCGTNGSYKRITQVEGLQNSIESCGLVEIFDYYETFDVQFGGGEKTFTSSDVVPFLISILMENENVDITYEEPRTRPDRMYSHVSSSTTFFDIEMDYHYQHLQMTTTRF